jgi:hypothetical protein
MRFTAPNLWMLREAFALGCNVTLITPWNGEGSDGPGGTADLVERACARGARTVILNTKTLLEKVNPKTRAQNLAVIR